MNNVTALAMDLVKYIYQLHSINERGKKVFCKKVSRSTLIKLIPSLPE